MGKQIFSIATIVVSLLFAGPVSAAYNSDELRVALVIGNSDYAISPLASPVADARGVSQQLRKLGFHVISVENGRAADMVLALREFGDTLQAVGGVGLFYYAGHGIQVDGENYLIPVDTDVRRQHEIKYSSLSLNQVLGEMGEAHNRVNMVVLDACRDNPFGTRSRSLRSAGLAPLSDAPSGTLISFATAPGQVAVDGDDNGTFTKHFLRHLATPGLAVEQMFKLVRRGVMDETDDFQVPWENSSLTGDFFFNATNDNPEKLQPLTVSIDQLRLRPSSNSN